MILRGYLDGHEPPVGESVLVAVFEWMDDPRWWPAFLWSVGGSRAAAGAFDADQPDGERGPAERLLLLLPAVGDAGLPADAADLVTAAVTAAGARRQQQEIAYAGPCARGPHR
ncbi:MAG TPA: hypothetical protein VE198_13680 [Actinoallomurus sp.]|nr:hypothetical protein [Actinoallomurus sp.]